MTPNDLDQYLAVMEKRSVGQAAIKLPDGTELSVLFAPKMPSMSGDAPTPGGWKTPTHLDNVEDLRPDFGREYKGELP